MEFRTAYSPQLVVGLEFDPDEDMTRQSFKDECNINNIVARFIQTGAVDHVREYGAQYGEVSSMDLHEAMNTALKAQDMFDALPAKLREHFGQDPGVFLDFVADPANLDEMKQLGLVRPEPVDPPGAPEGGAAEPPSPPPKESPTGDAK